MEHFNSIKVRLEYFDGDYWYVTATLFQFHKGAIGVTRWQKYALPCVQFQFHKGAIGVAAATVADVIKLRFQFHKGAIGVQLYLRLCRHKTHFNSIKVRLE